MDLIKQFWIIEPMNKKGLINSIIIYESNTSKYIDLVLLIEYDLNYYYSEYIYILISV